MSGVIDRNNTVIENSPNSSPMSEKDRAHPYEDFYDKPLPPIVPPLAEEEEEIPITPPARYLLKCAIKEMEDREDKYDTPEGERSMAATVEMFNTLTQLGMTERQGWMFMSILKMVRAEYNGYRKDDYVDGAAYMALGGECAAKE